MQTIKKLQIASSRRHHQTNHRTILHFFAPKVFKSSEHHTATARRSKYTKMNKMLLVFQLQLLRVYFFMYCAFLTMVSIM